MKKLFIITCLFFAVKQSFCQQLPVGSAFKKAALNKATTKIVLGSAGIVAGVGLLVLGTNQLGNKRSYNNGIDNAAKNTVANVGLGTLGVALGVTGIVFLIKGIDGHKKAKMLEIDSQSFQLPHYKGNMMVLKLKIPL